MAVSIKALEKGIEILVRHQKLQKPDFTLEGCDLELVIEIWSKYFSEYQITDDIFINNCKKIACEKDYFPTAREILGQLPLTWTVGNSD